MESFDNIKIEENVAYLSIDLSIYSLKTIYSTSYVFLDRVYIQFLSKKSNVVLVRLKLKSKPTEGIENLAGEFLNELIVFEDYNRNQEESLKVREAILQRVLLTNDPDSFHDNLPQPSAEIESDLLDKEFENFLSELDKEDNLQKKN